MYAAIPRKDCIVLKAFLSVHLQGVQIKGLLLKARSHIDASLAVLIWLEMHQRNKCLGLWGTKCVATRSYYGVKITFDTNIMTIYTSPHFLDSYEQSNNCLFSRKKELIYSFKSALLCNEASSSRIKYSFEA